MANGPLEATVISAKGLNNVNLFSKMEVYVAAMITGNERSRKRTSIDEGTKNHVVVGIRQRQPPASAVVAIRKSQKKKSTATKSRYSTF